MGPPAQAAVVVLYGVGAAWRALATLGPAAPLAGTAALAVVWFLSSRRAAEPC
jgi:hypothetical protein